ncbi:MAG: hypothetical protein R2685_17270 [Candidatus Nitrosocosmicus sp.]|nr:hypothetical protein [Candidatus Nitrosocosmicus sp.]
MYLKELDSLPHLPYLGKDKKLQGAEISSSSDSVIIQIESGGIEKIKSRKHSMDRYLQKFCLWKSVQNKSKRCYCCNTILCKRRSSHNNLLKKRSIIVKY